MRCVMKQQLLQGAAFAARPQSRLMSARTVLCSSQKPAEKKSTKEISLNSALLPGKHISRVDAIFTL